MPGDAAGGVHELRQHGDDGRVRAAGVIRPDVDGGVEDDGGPPRRPGSACSRARVSSPERPGMFRSRKMSRGRRARISRRASSPPAASRTGAPVKARAVRRT